MILIKCVCSGWVVGGIIQGKKVLCHSKRCGVSFKGGVVFHSKGVWCFIQRSGDHSKEWWSFKGSIAGDVSRGGDVSFNRCDVLVGVGVGWAAAAILCKLHMQSYLSKSITY